MFDPYYLNAPIKNYSRDSYKATYDAIGVLLYSHEAPSPTMQYGFGSIGAYNNNYYRLCFLLMDYDYFISKPNTDGDISYYLKRKDETRVRLIKTLEEIESKLFTIEV